jgi:hypothetical protein
MVIREMKRGRVSWLHRGAGAEDICEREGGGSACGGNARSVGGGRRSAQAARLASQPGAVHT